MIQDIKIGKFVLGTGHAPMVVAEMSGNHNQSLERALSIVDAAAKTGAHALKIQTFTPDTITMKSDREEFLIKDSKNLWRGRNLYDLYGEAQTPWEWHKAIFDRCHQHGMIGFSTPFDESAVDFLESLGAPCYKIASFENNHLPLIRKVAATGKPVIISTGMASLADLEECVAAFRSAGGKDLILLKCTSTYPAAPKDTNIRTIPHLREAFGCHTGLSDHTMGVGVSVASVALGAVLVEKHFTLSRAEGGVDAAFSLEPSEFTSLVQETARAWEGLGQISYGPTNAEMASLKFRRSLYAVEDIGAGENFSSRNIRSIRPGLGLEPKHLETVLGKKARRAIPKGTPLSWELLD